jgi:hypothetical protein
MTISLTDPFPDSEPVLGVVGGFDTRTAGQFSPRTGKPENSPAQNAEYSDKLDSYVEPVGMISGHSAPSGQGRSVT